MNLEIIRTQTTWNDAAGSINSNYAKIADAIAQLKANGGGGGGGAADTIVWSKVTDKPAWIIQAGNSKPKYSYDELTDTPDLSELATKTWVESELSDYAKTETVEALSTKVGNKEDNTGIYKIISDVETALIEDIPTTVSQLTDSGDYLKKASAEITYATIASVQGFENRIGGLEGAVPQLNERVSTVEGKVSSLNETVSTGENNLLDRVNVIETDYVTSGNLESAINGIDLSAYLLKADLTKSRIQSTLGISDWALAATKPSYAWSEITSRPTALSQFTDDVVAGKYLPVSGGTLSNAAWRSQLTIERSGSTNDSVIAFKNSNGLLGCLGYRGADGVPCVWLGETGTGTPIIHANNIGSYNAGSANILQALSDKYVVTANKRDDYWEVALKIGGWHSKDAGFATRYGTVVDIAGFNTWYHRLGFNTNGTIEHWMGINTFEMSRVGYLAYLTSNVASATKLQTPRKLWGNDFDGTADVSGNLISPRFETTALSASTPKRKAALEAGGLKVYGADNSGWASGIYTYNADDNTYSGAIAAAYGSSSYTPLFYYYGGIYNDPFLKIYQNDRRIISSGLFLNIGKEILPYASNRTEIALINPNAEPSMLRLGSNGDVKWGIETGGSTDNYAFSIYSWTAATHCLRILNNGNVGIGNTSPAERLEVSGNIKASGNINATSITINGVTITASNGSITVNGNVLATGAITAKAVG